MRRLRGVIILLLTLALAGCGTIHPALYPTSKPTLDLSATQDPRYLTALAPLATPSPTPTLTPDPAQPWGSYAGPRLPAATAIPSPVEKISVPDEVRILALLGTDSSAPFISRTDEVLLVIYHPRLAKAALLSLPPDLLVYIPGYTMQRLGVAYAVSGARGFQRTIQYNLGIRPDSWAFVHYDDFARFIDDLGGIQATILEPVVNLCGGIPEGTWLLNGQQALCYATFRIGADEPARNRRQQEILRLTLERLITGGNLVRLPELWETYAKTVDTNLTLDDLLQSIPLALKFGDPARMRYYTLLTDELPRWHYPSEDRTEVFLPDYSALRALVQDALAFVQEPAPLAERVVTLQYELTVSPTPSDTPTATETFTPTFTSTATRTPYPTRTYTRTMTFTPSSTRTTTPTRSQTPTVTQTPTPTLSPTLTPTPSETPTPTPTLTSTP